MIKYPMVGLADIVRCMAVAKSDKDLEGMAKVCGYEKIVNEKPEKKDDENA